MTAPEPFFTNDDIISRYTRADAISDGQLKDLTEWASSTKGFIGGFTCSVAVTASVWSMIEDLGGALCQDVRGRAHDVLYMACLALKTMVQNQRITEGRISFQVILPTSGAGGRSHKTLTAVIHGDDDGKAAVTIMLPSED